MSIRSRILLPAVIGQIIGCALALVTTAAQPALAATARASGAAASSSPARPAPGPEAMASRHARKTGRPVEVASERTATSTVFAEPNGTMRAVITAVPTRVRRGQGWVPVRTRLRRNAGGTFSPVAISQPLELSGGGTTRPLVEPGRGTARLSLRWPGRLPAPVVSGATATYRHVLPGVDLEVTATYGGFTEVLVVRSRAAGLRLLAHPVRLAISSPGLTVTPGKGGGLIATDQRGQVAVQRPGGDDVGQCRTRPEPAPNGPGGPRNGGVPTAAVAADAARQPGRAAAQPGDADQPGDALPGHDRPVVQREHIELDRPAAALPERGELERREPRHRLQRRDRGWRGPDNLTDARAMFQMNTVSMNSKHLLGATFRINEGWANSCTASDVDLWVTGAIASTTTWNNQPSWMTKLASVSAARSTDGTGNCAAGPLAFNALAGVQQAATNGWPNLTLGLRAGNEADTNSWKRFQAGSATLQVDYNTIPAVGTMSTIPALAPAVRVRRLLAGLERPGDEQRHADAGGRHRRRGRRRDPGEGRLRLAGVERHRLGCRRVRPGPDRAVTQHPDDIPDPGRQPDRRHHLPLAGSDRRSADVALHRHGPVALVAVVRVHRRLHTAARAQVTGTVYTPGCAPSCGGVGTTGAFTLNGGASDVSKYLYGFTDPPTTALTPSAQGGSVTFSFTPSHGGPTTLFVTSQDIGGNVSAETRYTFNVGSPAPAAGNWRLADTSDDTGAHPLTLVGGATLGVPAREVQDTALGLSGTGQYARTAGPVLDTSQSFSVSAWARITNTTGDHVVAAQAGTTASGFILEYQHSASRWAFAGVSADVASPAVNFSVTSAAAPTLGAWTLLTGTYDAATRTASLYVNGVPQGSQVAAAPTWNATGPLMIGADWSGGTASAFLAGSVSNAEVWQRVLQPSEVATMADPSGDPVGVYHFDEVGGSIAFDSSDYGNDLNLEGDAQIPASGAGHDGTGMLLMDGGGWAQSFSPVLNTDQSFTVAAWVRLDGTALPSHSEYALSQAGTTSSAFLLGYVATPSPHWAFQMPQADTASPVIDSAGSGALTTATLGVWHLLTGSFSAATNVMTLSVDGQVAAATTRTVAPWNAGDAFLAGSGWLAGGNAGPWTGAVDEIRVYQGVYNSPLDNWQFSSCTGTPVSCADQGTGNHALTLGSGATQVPSGYSGSGLSLTGAGAAATSATAVDTSTAFTASAWVDLAAVPGSDAVVVAEAGAHQDFFELGYSASRGQWCATVYSADAGTATAASACAGSVQTGTWTQLAAVFDPVHQSVTLYLDGALVATAADTASWKASGGVLVGGGLRNGAAAGLLTGRVDDVEILSGAVADPSTLQ